MMSSAPRARTPCRFGFRRENRPENQIDAALLRIARNAAQRLYTGRRNCGLGGGVNTVRQLRRELARRHERERVDAFHAVSSKSKG